MRDLDDALRSSDRAADRRDHDAAEDRQAAHPPGFAAAMQRRVMQRRADRAAASSHEAEAPATGGGEALAAPVRDKMEGAFGASFEDVRVHQGDQAERVGAEAYAQGDDLHFAPGRYAPGSPAGDELIGHELTHVVQQRAGRVAAPQQQHKGGINDDPSLEAEADAVGARAAAGERVTVPGGDAATAAGGPVQRKLTIGKKGAADPPREVDLEETEALVAEVLKLNDPNLTAAAKKVSADKPNGAIRDAILVLFRNDERFATMADLVAAATDRLLLIQNVAAVDWDKDVKDIAEDHPERHTFFLALDGRVEPDKIEALWMLTIQGVHYQKGLNAKNKKHDPNPHYIQLAQEFAELLAVQAGDKPALWSGGYDVSMFAQNKGFRTLEVTTAGKMFDQLKLFRDFSTLGPLWNNISKKFVSSFAGDTHVFVRTMDKGSVLFRQELGEAAHLEGVSSMKWHVLKGGDLATMSEVDDAGKPRPGHTFDGFRAAAPAMSADAFRAPAGKDAIKGEPDTAEGVRDKMVEEQKQVPAYVTKLKDFVDGRAKWLKVDGPEFQPKLDRLKARAEIRLKNDPALGVDLADLYAEIKDDLAKDIAHLAREKKNLPAKPAVDAGAAVDGGASDE